MQETLTMKDATFWQNRQEMDTLTFKRFLADFNMRRALRRFLRKIEACG